jgi:hypothetical protein
MSKTWEWVEGFHGMYQVSNLGDIFSLERNGTKGGILKKYFDRYGYEKVVLYKDNKPHYLTVHRVVAAAFIPNPEKKEQVNHKNGVRSDNYSDNLEWSTPKENVHHSFQFGKQKTIMKPIRVIERGTGKVFTFNSQREAAKELGLNQRDIHHFLCGRRTSSKYLFSYTD